MRRIVKHPILDIPEGEQYTFLYEGKPVQGRKGFTIAASLHQAGFPVHSHSLKNRSRSLECGIGKCGACEMLVDGEIKRICITRVDGIKEVAEIPKDYHPSAFRITEKKASRVFKTMVVIVGAGPAGLAVRDELNKSGIENIVIDSNDNTGGQFLMQTHQFFFFEKEKRFGGMRGFEIAESLAGDNSDGIFLHSVVWDIFENKRLAVKNIRTNEVYYVDSEYLVVAAGAVPFMPLFENDDLPGVYTAAVVQKMMNQEFTLLGKNILTVGAGNIGYLTSYQLMQAGANVKAVIEARPEEGGFPVQANRIRRLGIPILTSRILVKAIPNSSGDGICGAVIADSADFKPVPGTERILEGIDAVNICTGLVSDDLLLKKGHEIFGRRCFGAGDAIRIGEGTSAVLRGRQTAFGILEEMGENYDYSEYLTISKEYIDSQQNPVKVADEPFLPGEERRFARPFVIIDCLYGFACNPCVFACPHGAITKSSTSEIPRIDFKTCTGCMECVWQCPGLAIFGYNLNTGTIFFPVEYEVEKNKEVIVVDGKGERLGEGIINKVTLKKNKTRIAMVKATNISGDGLMQARGFILKEKYPEPLVLNKTDRIIPSESYVCHCDDVKMEEILAVVGDRRFISVDEIKHTTRLGMGACRGKRCIKRLKQVITQYGISVVGEPTPRGPMSNQIDIAELYPSRERDIVITGAGKKMPDRKKVACLIAGGGIAGSALFRYMADAGLKPLLVNSGHGASWRNIAGGRPAFSIPELSETARQNLCIFEELQKIKNIDFRKSIYVNFAHDEEMYRTLERSMQWQSAFMIEKKDFRKYISPSFDINFKRYVAALITRDCWQASPGKTIDLLRSLGINSGGKVLEDARLVSLNRDKGTYRALVIDHNKQYIEYQTEIFVNALGAEGDYFAQQSGYDTGLYPVRHQAFITRRLPVLGVNGNPLPMLIDRRKYKGFTAVYGQQLAETGQIIGCASPAVDAAETWKNLKVNTREFLAIISEVFSGWLPEISSAGFQAVWSGYYVEPRMIIDPEKGLFLGLRGQGFMLAQYLAKMYVDYLTGQSIPEYFTRLKLEGDGLREQSFQ